MWVLRNDERAAFGSNLGFHFQIGSTWYYVNPSFVPSTNTWYHVVGTYDLDVGKIYVNGRLGGATSSPSGAIDASTNIRIGAASDNGDNKNFDGLIDEVKIFNYALTPNQIQAEYNGGAVRVGQ